MIIYFSLEFALKLTFLQAFQSLDSIQLFVWKLCQFQKRFGTERRDRNNLPIQRERTGFKDEESVRGTATVQRQQTKRKQDLLNYHHSTTVSPG